MGGSRIRIANPISKYTQFASKLVAKLRKYRILFKDILTFLRLYYGDALLKMFCLVGLGRTYGLQNTITERIRFLKLGYVSLLIFFYRIIFLHRLESFNDFH